MSPEPVCLDQETEQGRVYRPLTLETAKEQALSPGTEALQEWDHGLLLPNHHVQVQRRPVTFPRSHLTRDEA